MKTIQQTLCFAKLAHKGQKRKYTGEPYINHPIAVAILVLRYIPNASVSMLQAAILHDVVEDTSYEDEDIEDLFGCKVADLVSDLTDVSKPEDGSRAVRKALDREHTAKASVEAQMVKLCDLMDNTESIVEHSKDFAKIYLAEKRLTLDAMSNEVKLTKVFAAAELTLQKALIELEFHDEKIKAEKDLQPA